MNVAEVCTREVAVAAPEEAIRDAARRMADKAIGTLIVVDALNRPIGIVTDRDLAVRCLAEGRDPARTSLADLMSGPPAWVREGQPVDDALEEMARLCVRRLPVVDERDRLVGILALDDVLARRIEPDSPLSRALRANLSL